MGRKRRLEREECDNCWGCGHVCLVCLFPINACLCRLDTEEMQPCEDCGATGYLEPDPPRFQQRGTGKA